MRGWAIVKNMAKKVKKKLFRLPYFGILLVIIFLGLLLLFDRKILPFVNHPNISLKTPVLQTEVIDFHPEIPSETQSGSCFTTSVTAPASNAYRCTVGNAIYDPCIFATDGKTLVCDADPAKGTPGFVLEYTSPLPEPDTDDKSLTNPWMIELASGRICSFAQGASGVIDDQRINYYCESSEENTSVVIIGDLKRGKLWNATRAVIDEAKPSLTVTETGVVPLKKVWIIN